MNNFINSGELIRIGLVDPGEWEQLNGMFVKFFAERAAAFLKEVGKQPFILPDDFFEKKKK